MLNKLRDRKNFDLIYSIIINLIIVTLFFIFTNLSYDMADCYFYSHFISEGYYDFGFMNYLFGVICGFIQTLIFPMNAFTVLHLILCFISFTTISFIFSKKHGRKISTIFILFLTSFFAVNHYVNVSFSFAPALFLVAGVVCIFFYSQQEKWLFGTIFGSVLIIFSDIYRIEVFLLGVCITAFFILGSSLTEYFDNRSLKTKSTNLFKIIFINKRFLIFLVLFLICFSVNLFSTFICNSSKETRYFLKYTNARSQVWDYEIPDYQVCKKEYDAIDIDENDIEMLRNGYMDDEGAFTYEKLQQIEEIKNNYNKSTKSIISTLKCMTLNELISIRILNDQGIACIAFTIIFLFYVVIEKKRRYFIPLLLIVPILGVHIYLWYRGRVPYRAVYALWFASAVYIMYSFSKFDTREYIKFICKFYRRLVCIIITGLVVVTSIFGAYFSNKANITFVSYSTDSPTTSINNYIDSHPNDRFELSRSVHVIKSKNNILFLDDILNNNYLIFNCTYYRSKYYDKQMSEFGTDNMYSNLLNENVYIIDSKDNGHIHMLQMYLNKYYVSQDQTIQMKKVCTIDDVNLYKFYVQCDDDRLE